jgi:hypothetical protein
MAMLAIAGPVLTRSDPAQNLPLRLEGPSLAHPLDSTTRS